MGPQGNAPAARTEVRPSVCRPNRKNDFCPRAHYCLPLLLLLCVSCAAAFDATEETGMAGRRVIFANAARNARANIQARD